MSAIVRVGLVGTGYAARLRADAFAEDRRSHLVVVAGNTPERTSEFCQIYGAEMADSWEAVMHRTDVDLVVIATVNRDHGAIAKAALQAGKHVVVEYPLALDIGEAEALVNLAQSQGRMLHVEQVDQLSGIHHALAAALPEVGTVFSLRYASLNAQRPAPQKWTYRHDLFGFPLVGAVSRVHRLTSLFGPVAQVRGQARFWYATEANPTQEYGFDDPAVAGQPYHTGLCSAQLRFTNGIIADLSYGKGEALWQSERVLEVEGTTGMVRVGTTEGVLMTATGDRPLNVGSRRGLFARDTTMVLDHLLEEKPLYVDLESSTYALRVADAIRRACTTGEAVTVSFTG
jgi:biliverdin reductase